MNLAAVAIAQRTHSVPAADHTQLLANRSAVVLVQLLQSCMTTFTVARCGQACKAVYGLML